VWGSAQIARAVAWNVVTGVGARVIGLVGTLLLARFIVPDEYGEVSIAAVCVTTVRQFSNLEFGQYLIVKGHDERDAAFHATVYHLGLGFVALAAVYLFRDQLGPWLGAPAMGRFIPGFILATALERVAQTPEKLLARDLRFRVIAVTRGVGEVTYTALALSFAPSIGGMAIVLGNIGRAALAMIVFVAAADREWLRPVRLSWSKSLKMLRYSLPLAFANMTDFASGRWDNLLISRFHGAGVAGTYNLAYNLAQTSTGSLADQILDVLFPSFARVEPRHRGQALVRAISIMALLILPLAFGLAAVAGTLVAAIFPPRWSQLAPMLVVLSVQAAAGPLAWTLQTFYRAHDRTAFVMGTSVFKLVVLLGALAAIGPFGPLWACVAVDVTMLSHLIVLWSGLRRDYPGVGWRAARGSGQALLACVPMVVCVLGVRALERLWGPVSAPWALCFELPAGAAGYFVGAFLFARTTSADVVGLVQRLIRSKGSRDGSHNTPGDMMRP
jgi:PST family polysaccharide transporter